MFDFNRRINRRTFLLGWVLAITAWLPAFKLADVFYGPGGEDHPSSLSLGILVTYALTFFVYTLCLTKQRCNDFISDHAFLIGVLLYVSNLEILGVFIPGEKKANKYGPVPKKRIKLI